MSHRSLYNANGLLFWSEEEIRIRNMFVSHMVSAIHRSLMSMNQAFKMVQCEAPIITPIELINPNYSASDYYPVSQENNQVKTVLRPETTMGSYAYARHILSGYHDPKYKLPICVWQHGKSFRREQDQPTKFMRLKEFHQLEFQVLFSATTSNDYYPKIVEDVRSALEEVLTFIGRPRFVGRCDVEPSDRLPDYSEETTDIVFRDELTKLRSEGMEVCSISRRKDYDPQVKNVEVAIGTDRCVFNYMKRREKPEDESN